MFEEARRAAGCDENFSWKLGKVRKLLFHYVKGGKC